MFLLQSEGASRKVSLRKVQLPLIPRDKRTNQPNQKAEESVRRVQGAKRATRNRRKQASSSSSSSSSSSRFFNYHYMLMLSCNWRFFTCMCIAIVDADHLKSALHSASVY